MPRLKLIHKSVADPGFPRGGGTNSQGGVPAYDFVNFYRKVHENEEILAAGGVSPAPPPLDPPLQITIFFMYCFSNLRDYLSFFRVYPSMELFAVMKLKCYKNRNSRFISFTSHSGNRAYGS